MDPYGYCVWLDSRWFTEFVYHIEYMLIHSDLQPTDPLKKFDSPWISPWIFPRSPCLGSSDLDPRRGPWRCWSLQWPSSLHGTHGLWWGGPTKKMTKKTTHKKPEIYLPEKICRKMMKDVETMKENSMCHATYIYDIIVASLSYCL